MTPTASRRRRAGRRRSRKYTTGGKRASTIWNIGGRVNERRNHACVCQHVLLGLGGAAYAPWGSLETLLEEARVKYLPHIPTRTLRRWYEHYQLYGETMPETRKWEEIGLYRKEQPETAWQQSDTDMLKDMIDDKPYLYLDEIRELLGLITGRWWSCYEWLETTLTPCLGLYEDGAPRSVVVLDNASIHHNDYVVEVIESVGAKGLYTAPYSHRIHVGT